MALPDRLRPAGSTGYTRGTATQLDRPSALIRLVGGVDLATAPLLDGYAERLRGLVLRCIVVDLTAVTYVGSTFVNFLDTLHRAHPESELILQSPSMLARIVLAATGMNGHVVMIGHPVSAAVESPDLDDAVVTIVRLDPAAAIGRSRTSEPIDHVRPDPRPEPPVPTR